MVLHRTCSRSTANDPLHLCEVAERHTRIEFLTFASFRWLAAFCLVSPLLVGGLGIMFGLLFVLAAIVIVGVAWLQQGKSNKKGHELKFDGVWALLVIGAIGWAALAGWLCIRMMADGYHAEQTISQIERLLPAPILGAAALTFCVAGTRPQLAQIGLAASICAAFAMVFYANNPGILVTNATLNLFGLPLPEVRLPRINKLMMGHIWTLGAFLCLLGLHETPGWSRRAFQVAGFLICAYLAVVLTGSRAPALVLIGLLPFVGLYIFLPSGLTRRQIVIRTLALICGGVILLLGVVTLAIWAEISIVGRLAGAWQQILVGADQRIETSLYQRFVMYDAGWSAFVEQPIFGYGMHQRWAAIAPYLSDTSFTYTHLHNFALNQLVDGGIVALFFSVVVLFTLPAGWLIYRPAGIDALYAAMAVTLANLVLGLTNSLFAVDTITMMTAMSTAILIAAIGFKR